MLNFVGFINENWAADPAVKQAMLVDFCNQYNYQEFVEDPDDPTGDPIPNPVSRVQFANEKITLFIVQTVNQARLKAGREAVVIEELELE